MTRLEERYRLALRMLPVPYRQAWEEEMVAAFLDSVHTADPEDAEYLADYGRPSWSEVASVAALGARLRLGLSGGQPRSVAWGQAVRLAVLMAMLANAVMAVSSIVTLAWLAGGFPSWPAPPDEWPLAAASLAGCLWVPAYLALVLGHPRIAQLIALPAVGITAISATVYLASGRPFMLYFWAEVLLNLAMTLLDYVRVSPIALGLAEAGAVAAVGVPLLVIATGALRRLPVTEELRW